MSKAYIHGVHIIRTPPLNLIALFSRQTDVNLLLVLFFFKRKEGFCHCGSHMARFFANNHHFPSRRRHHPSDVAGEN